MPQHELQESHRAAYFNVLMLLCVLTLTSIIAGVIGFQNKLMLGAFVFAIAITKALWSMMYFMHLKFEKDWKYLLLVPTVILAVALPVSLRPDIGETYYVSDVPQLTDYSEHEASLHRGDAEHH